MSLFKRVFGSGTPESDKRLEKELDQVKSGEIHKIYPILKPGDWVGIQAGALRQTIVGTQEAPLLVVAIGYDAPTNFIFLKSTDIEGKDPNAVLKEAFSNLENIEQEFEKSTQFDGQILLASGNDFSSEKILSKSHMMKAHTLLDAEELLVSIPRRRCMMITSRNAEKELLSKFIHLHQHAWNDDSYRNPPIINALFIVKSGEIQGLIPFDSE